MADGKKQESAVSAGLHEIWGRGQKLLTSSRRNMLIFGGAVLLIGLALALIDRSPPIAHLDNALLSGSKSGHYARLAKELSEHAQKEGGELEVVLSQGSQDNLEKLLASADSCEHSFAFVQDGLDWPDDERITLLGRLTHPELVLFFRKKDAGVAPLTRFAQLKDRKIGIGSAGSGTARVGQQIFGRSSFSELNLELVHAPFDEQVALLKTGALDLVLFVIHPDAAIIKEAMQDPALELVSFEHTESLASHIPALSAGLLKAGHFDPVSVLPDHNVQILQVDTLVLGNSCASTSQVYGMMSLLADRYPSFVRLNQTPSHDELPPMNQTASQFLESGEVGFVERTFPWLVDLLPLGNLVQIIMVVSILFNLMGVGHRFRLWRLDANRMATEQAIHELFGYGTSFEAIEEGEVQSEHVNATTLTQLRAIHAKYSELYERCRKQSISILVPMGREMAYRYQEHLMQQSMVALEQYIHRVESRLETSGESPV